MHLHRASWDLKRPKNSNILTSVEGWGVGCWDGALVVQNSPAYVRNIRHVGLIPGSERSPGGGNGHPLQYSCLENPME